MAEEIRQQLHLVEVELRQVQDQISSLLEHQENLLQQEAELHSLLAQFESTSAKEENKVDQVAEDCEDKWSGAFPWDKEADEVRLNVFGISTYRTNQREVINATMTGRDVIVVMAAGGGKSLCYQLPALLKSGTALIVSPLLSLIQDQVMGLTALGIPGGMLTSVTSKQEEKDIYKCLEKGDGDLKVLYVTPEKIAKSKRFMSKLEKCNQAGRLSLIAIDEAHCCSQWGHDFRPDYKNLGILKKQFPKVPIIALTATATARVQTDLREMLQLSKSVKFVSTVNRPNLFYEVREKSSNALTVIDEIADFIKQAYPRRESGIVYCFSRKECQQVAKELQDRGISASHYHAEMDPNARSNVHNRWSSNKLQVIVGTVAFGMGINKPDVRFVIHHSLGKSLETYYQESGRAGRDGLPSHCLLFFRPPDLPRQSSMVFYEHAGLHNLYTMVRFCQLKRLCRREAFFQHFAERLQECKGMCDNCAYGQEIVEMDVTAHAKSLVSMVKDLEGSEKKLTLLQLVDLWKSRSPKTGQVQTDPSLAKDLKKDDVEQVIVQLILEGVLKEEFQHTAYATNAYLACGSAWRLLVQGQKKIILELYKGGKVKKQVMKFSSGGVESGMTNMLENLRQDLAQRHGGLFPYAILSSQQIYQLSIQKPISLDDLEGLIGKRKTEQYGKDIVDGITEYMSKNPEACKSEWKAPKPGLSSSSPLANGIKGVNSKNTPARKTNLTSSKTTKSKRKPARRQSEYIDLDSSEESKEKCGNAQNEDDDDDDDDEDEDFVLAKRVKR